MRQRPQHLLERVIEEILDPPDKALHQPKHEWTYATHKVFQHFCEEPQRMAFASLQWHCRVCQQQHLVQSPLPNSNESAMDATRDHVNPNLNQMRQMVIVLA